MAIKDNSIVIATKNRPTMMVVELEAFSPCIIKMTGKSLTRQNSVYFSRIFGESKNKFTGVKKFYFPMPITPYELEFSVACIDDKYADIEILDVKCGKLNQDELWLREDEKDFLDFAIEFAQRSGYTKTGVIKSDSEKYIIIYKEDIRNQDGKVDSTPARISRSTGIIEISKSKFNQYTIPMRLIILLHEFMHWRLNTRVEIEADFNALNIFFKLGFPKTEGLYAFTKVFNEDKDHLVERVEKIYKFISDFDHPLDREKTR